MATRRHSRTPMVLTDTNRRVMIAAADANPDLRAHIETLIGKAWASLTADQKVGALTEFEEVGYAAGSLAGAARGLSALESAAAQRRGDVSLADKVALLEEQVRAKDEELAAKAALLAAAEKDVRTVRSRRTAEHAKPALVVHSEPSR